MSRNIITNYYNLLQIDMINLPESVDNLSDIGPTEEFMDARKRQLEAMGLNVMMI
jgi:hypothetical protein